MLATIFTMPSSRLQGWIESIRLSIGCLRVVLRAQTSASNKTGLPSAAFRSMPCLEANKTIELREKHTRKLDDQIQECL